MHIVNNTGDPMQTVDDELVALSDADLRTWLRNLVIMDEVSSNNPLAKEAADRWEALQTRLERYTGLLSEAADLLEMSGYSTVEIRKALSDSTEGEV